MMARGNKESYMRFYRSDVELVDTILTALLERPITEVRQYLSDQTIYSMMDIQDRIKCYAYCKKHRISYENMTMDDVDAVYGIQ